MRRRMTLIFLTGLLTVPVVRATVVVLDPFNLSVNVEQVVYHLELVTRLNAQIRNQQRMLASWEFSRLDGMLASMESVRGVLDADKDVYRPLDVDDLLEQQYPLSSDHYAHLDAAAAEALRGQWIAAQRHTLVQARTAQNRVYLEMSSSEGRIADYVQQSNAAPGQTAAMQAGNEIVANLVGQMQAMQALEISDARAEIEAIALKQAKAAYHRTRRDSLMRDWPSGHQ